MKKITKSNYEAYFLDHYEGSLSAEAEKELLEFLILYPELKEEFESFENICLHPETISFGSRQSLKKEEPVSEESIIAYLEGDLDREQSGKLRKMISTSPFLQETLRQFEKARLIPDASIQFPGKRALKKSGTIRPLYIATAVAASLSLFVAGYLLWNSRNMPPAAQQAFLVPEPAAPSRRAAEKPEVIAQKAQRPDKRGRAVSAPLPHMEAVSRMPGLPARTQIMAEMSYAMPTVEQPAAPASPKQGFRSEEFTSIPETLKRRVQKKIRDIASKQPSLAKIAEKKDKSIWDYASAGLDGLSRITNIRYEKSVDSTGTQYSRLVAGAFEYSSSSSLK